MRLPTRAPPAAGLFVASLQLCGFRRLLLRLSTRSVSAWTAAAWMRPVNGAREESAWLRLTQYNYHLRYESAPGGAVESTPARQLNRLVRSLLRDLFLRPHTTLADVRSDLACCVVFPYRGQGWCTKSEHDGISLQPNRRNTGNSVPITVLCTDFRGDLARRTRYVPKFWALQTTRLSDGGYRVC